MLKWQYAVLFLVHEYSITVLGRRAQMVSLGTNE